MEPSPYSERFTIACNNSRVPAGGGSGFRVQAGGGSGCCPFRRPAGNQQVFPLYGPMLRYRINMRKNGKVPDASLGRGRDPCTMLARVIVRLKPSDSFRRCRAYPPSWVEHPHNPA